MKTTIWIISGYSASGKTTLARELHLKLGIPLISHSYILNKLALQNGFSSSKDFVFNYNPEEFKRLFDEFSLEQIEGFIKNKSEVIIEALASINILTYLNSNPYNNTEILFIDVPKTERMRRIIESRKGTVDESIDRIKSFIGLDMIIEQADYIIDGTESPLLIFKKVMTIMKG